MQAWLADRSHPLATRGRPAITPPDGVGRVRHAVLTGRHDAAPFALHFYSVTLASVSHLNLSCYLAVTIPACLLRSTSLWAGASAIFPLHLDKRLLTALTSRNELKMTSLKTPPDAAPILQWRCFSANKKLVGQGTLLNVSGSQRQGLLRKEV